MRRRRGRRGGHRVGRRRSGAELLVHLWERLGGRRRGARAAHRGDGGALLGTPLPLTGSGAGLGHARMRHRCAPRESEQQLQGVCCRPST